MSGRGGTMGIAGAISIGGSNGNGGTGGACEHVIGVQPGSTQMPPRHSFPPVQSGHISLWPQLSPISPQ